MKNEKTTLERLRSSLGFSQSEIADRLKVSRPTYVRIEKGEKELTLGQTELLSGLYNIPIEAIRTGYIPNGNIQQEDIVKVTIPTKFGTFDFNVWNQPKGEEVIFLTTPNLDLQKPVLVRVHSECMTGDIFHSYRCDCGQQKDKALEMITNHGNGILIYLRQEGRGIGLHEKIKAYVLQDAGYDTHEANIILGHKPDYREYSWVKKVLNHLGINEIKLLTNNPSKVSEISRLGIKITERVPLVIESNIYNRRYFETKKQKFKHFFGKEESNYFYQFSDVENVEQVEEIGIFLKDLKKDPLLKICIGVSCDTHTLQDTQSLKNIEAIFKAASMYEGFVPILHFTFKFSSDPIGDIASVREKMSYVKYIQLNDVTENHINILKYANKFFLVDFPLSDEDFYLIDEPIFVQEIIDNKAFVLLDNSKGRGIQEPRSNLMNKINKLLEKGISDIAIYGGFGPDALNTYFELKEHYKINFSVDAETKLKTNQKLDLEKVKKYLHQLIKYNSATTKPKKNFVEATREIINSSKDVEKLNLIGLSIMTDPEVFNPKTFFSSQWYASEVSSLVSKEKTFIEIGCGTGIVSIKTAKNNPAIKILSTDINPKAKELTDINAKENSVESQIVTYCGDVLDSIPKEVRADSIFWSMPFGLLDQGESLNGRDWQVFDPGYRAIKKFFSTAKNYLNPKGKILIGFSEDIGNFDYLEGLAKENGFTLTLLKKTQGVEKNSVSMEIWEGRMV